MDNKYAKEAAALLRNGKLVAFPTETVYGLGGNALMDAAVAAIYAVKGRPSFNPLIVHVASLAEAERYAVFSAPARALARQFWPGPLTLVLPRHVDSPLSLLLSAGLDSVAIRVPAHPLALALLEEAGLPVAAPSANRSGRISPTEAGHVLAEFGACHDDGVAMLLNGGPCRVGLESTVVSLTGDMPLLLRPGSITSAQLRACIGDVQQAHPETGHHGSPGMLKSHYAPTLPVRLMATTVTPDEALLAFGRDTPQGAHAVENLSPDRDLHEASANLFRMLRLLDASGARGIAVMEIPEVGLGVAINDRLRRAAYSG